MEAFKELLSTTSTRGLAVGLITLCAACAGPNLALQEAQQDYATARQDPQVMRHASVALHEAEQALEKAVQADEEKQIEHHAYIASQRVEIARAETERKMAEARAERLLEEREQVMVEARTRQVKEATARTQVVEQELTEATARTQALEEALAALQAKKTERGFMLTLGDVLFEYDRAILKPGAKQNLHRLVRFLHEHPDQSALIEGHTDSRGSDAYNADLSQRRAQAVQTFLLSNGIEGERIVARGYGEAYPVASNDTVAGRQQNRRVEIVITEDPQQGGIANED
jgi:outer membrane protein OmpA-like peptidoglycan-associated protein